MKDEETLAEVRKYIAKTISGLEDVLAEELVQMGAQDVEVLNRAVAFTGDVKMMYKANYCSRTALRVLSPLFSFQLADEDDLYQNIFEYPWEELMEVTQTLAIDAVVSESELTHSQYVALRSKDAIVDRFREKFNGRRPSVDLDDPDFRLNIHIFGNTCDVSLDSSGISLHKRGYRVSNAEAPMSEVLAAGMILMSGWDKKSHFIDPMCGSGTLLIEAAMIANNFPAGLYRKSFGFMKWKDFNRELWDEVIQQAEDEQVEFEFKIIGNDISAKNLAAAKANLKSARLHKDIQLIHGPFSDLLPPEGEPGIVMINPPYGERIKTRDIIGLYKEIGDNLKKHFTGYKAWVISSDHYALKSVGLRALRKTTLWNGPLECKFAGFDLYEGTKKQKEYKGDDEQLEGTADLHESILDEAADTNEEIQEATGIAEAGEKKEKPSRRKAKVDKENVDSEQLFHEKENDSKSDVDDEREDSTTKPQAIESRERPYRKDSHEDRPFRKDDRHDKPFRKDDREGRPFRKDDRHDKPFRREDREDRPFRKDDRHDKPFRRNDREDRPFRKDDRHDKPFRRDDREDRPFRKDDRHDRPFRRDDREDRPFRKDDRHDKPFRRDDREDRPFRKDDRHDKPFRRDDRDDRPFRKDDRHDKPFRREDREDRPFRKDDRHDKPFRKDDRGDRPFRKEDRERGHSDRDKGFSRDSSYSSRKRSDSDKPRFSESDKPRKGKDPKKEFKPVELYQPQNRFEKPEKSYRRSDGKVNQGNPSGNKSKSEKPKRPRKKRDE